MVVTDCEINVQSYIPHRAPVARRVPKHTYVPSYPCEDTAFISRLSLCSKSLLNNPKFK